MKVQKKSMSNLVNYFNKYKQKKITVIGAGISNTPLIDLLLGLKLDVTVRDKRTENELGAIADKFIKKGAVLKLGDTCNIKNVNHSNCYSGIVSFC